MRPRRSPASRSPASRSPGAMGFYIPILSEASEAAGAVLQPITSVGGQIIQGTVNGAGQILNGAGQIVGYTLEGARRVFAPIINGAVNIAQNAVNSIDPKAILQNLEAVSHVVANIHVQLNPARLLTNVLQENPYTEHAYEELDKFTGGMITSSVNVSDLVDRVARGDTISKQELARDAVYLLQVLAIGTGGGAALGAIIGNMVGNEACKTIQHRDQKTACQAAFTVVGAAAGGSIASSGSFSDRLTTGVQKTFITKVTEPVTRAAVIACQAGQWAGAEECAILGKIASDYARGGYKEDWLSFLGREAAQIGVTQLIRDAFPPNSPERRALEQHAGFVRPDIPDVPKVPTHPMIQNQASGEAVIPPWLIAAGFIGAFTVLK